MKCFNHLNGQHLQIEDARIYFETAGNPNGQPLLLLHGGLGSIIDFNGILERLPSQFSFIGIDLRGHGRSTTGSARLSYARYQSDVEAVLTYLNISSVSIIGFSDGGIVGYRMAAEENSKVQKLVTLGAQWRLKEDDPSFSMLAGLTADMWMEMFPDSVRYYEKVNPNPDFNALVEKVVGLWTDLGPTGYPGEAVQIIKCPLLIVRGDDDELLSLSEAGELRSLVKGSGLLNIPFAGHEVHKDSPDIFAIAADDFLTQPR